MKQFNAHILENQNLKGNFYKLTLKWESEVPLPGQFMTLRINEHPFPLLRRPFAFSSFDPAEKQASIIYVQRGQATYLLTEKHEREQIDCIGPLGNAFPWPSPDKLAILVAGGTGLGPILFLARELTRRGQKFIFIFGARTRSLVPDTPELGGMQPVYCTDDGTLGFKGTVVDYLATLPQLQAPDTRPSGSANEKQVAEIFCCGPIPMLKACHELAVASKLTCWVSMEQVMACALGACMGCVIELANGFARVCKEGPVFDSRSIKWI